MENSIFEAPIGKIKPNPKNPRFIKDESFEALVISIRDFPQMLWKRPLVCFTDVDNNFVLLGGDKRLRACKELKFKKVQVTLADDWTEEQKAEFIIKDNLSAGEWDWEILKTGWDTTKLEAWGLKLPNIEPLPNSDELIGEEKNKPAIIKITFVNTDQLEMAKADIDELLNRKYPGAFFSISAGEI